MGPAVVSYRFQRMPAASRYFPRALFGRRSALVPDGQTVPRLEASVANVRAAAATSIAIAKSADLPTTGCCRSPIRTSLRCRSSTPS